ncbi:MAG: endolytic transglycosylase MltG [Spirochaetales bacterium]|nr:endolytic transglycosylase MltG [Spirochaetales bacterium]
MGSRRKEQGGSGRAFRILLIAGLVALAAGFYLLSARPSANQETVDFEVPPGSGIHRVATDLESRGLIASAEAFKLYMRLSGKASAIKAGTYELSPALTMLEIGERLSSGKVKLMALTIPEGWTNRQIGDYLAARGLVRDRADFLRLTADATLLGEFSIPAETTEGYLFPETYHVPSGYSALQLQKLMIKNFRAALRRAAVPEDLRPDLLHERVILASIVEREAVRPEERPMMAQVFINRLEKKMRLESCATIQYLFDKPKPRLFEKDLKIDSPYNTYQIKGLPPGPVSNPGLAAIRAAFAPEKSTFLYFVLKPDGSHHFSETYKEHLEAKKKYLGT